MQQELLVYCQLLSLNDLNYFKVFRLQDQQIELFRHQLYWITADSSELRYTICFPLTFISFDLIKRFIHLFANLSFNSLVIVQSFLVRNHLSCCYFEPSYFKNYLANFSSLQYAFVSNYQTIFQKLNPNLLIFVTKFQSSVQITQKQLLAQYSSVIHNSKQSNVVL